MNKITLNGKTISSEDLTKKKKEIASKKGVKLQEVSKDKYIIKIQG